MKKVILFFLLCLGVSGPSFAQNNAQAMRFLTVNALMQYGQRLYDRGDFDEATAVFDHVLTYDGHQAQALQYLKEMGKEPVQSVNAAAQPQKPQTSVPEKNNIIIKKTEEVDIGSVDISDTKSIEEAIKVQKLIVEKLRAQVKELRANQKAENATEQ